MKIQRSKSNGQTKGKVQLYRSEGSLFKETKISLYSHQTGNRFKLSINNLIDKIFRKRHSHTLLVLDCF